MESEESRHLLEVLRKELLMMCGLRHPNIVRLFGVYAPGTRHIGLVMELMDTSLQCRTTEGPPLLTSCLVHVLHDVTSALAYLHSRNILHRDISPRNTLLSEDSAQRRVVAKLSDFATAKAVDTVGFDRYSATSSQIGTLSYLPYEAIDKDPDTDKLVYSSAVDVYSVGAVGLFAALRKVPGGTPRAKAGFLRSLGPKHALHSVLKECLEDDPRLRPTSVDLQIRLERLQESEVCGGNCCQSSANSSRDRVEQLHAELMLHGDTIQKFKNDLLGSVNREQAARLEIQQLKTKLEISQRQFLRLQQQLKADEEWAGPARKRAITSSDEEQEQYRLSLLLQPYEMTTGEVKLVGRHMHSPEAAVEQNPTAMDGYHQSFEETPSDKDSAINLLSSQEVEKFFMSENAKASQSNSTQMDRYFLSFEETPSDEDSAFKRQSAQAVEKYFRDENTKTNQWA